MADENKIRVLDWRQGSAIPAPLLAILVEAGQLPALGSNACALLLSQDCDVVNSSFEAEPLVEVIAGSILPPEAVKRDLQWGRHPRRLHIFARDGALVELHAHERHFFRREYLATEGPSLDRSIEGLQLEVLRNWIANRYLRPAFPDAFNIRAKTGKKGIAAALKSSHAAMSRLFLQMNTDDELPVGTAYEVLLWIVVTDQTFGSESELEAVRGSAAKLAAALDACEGINVLDHRVVPESQFSLADLRDVSEWDFDHLTYADEYPA